ncbi:MAG: hypothetical protein J7L75_03435 [Thermoproteales archaeon]|nr:hypothetical protein [Thermoproteales archaeon]
MWEVVIGVAQINKRYEHLVFQSANIKAIFQFLAKESGENIVVNPNVSASVTLDLTDITWQQVVNLLLETYSLTMVKEEGFYRVLNTSDYRAKEKEAKQYEKERKQLIDRVTKVYKVQHAKAGEISASLQPALSNRGNIITDGRSNSLIVTDIPEQFPKLESLLSKLDVKTHQVKVSAKIMLVQSSFLHEMGVQWRVGTPPQYAQADQDFSSRDANIQSGVQSGIQIGSEADQVAEKLGHFTWGVITGEYSINAAISAITSNNKGKIIDEPNIITQDNKQGEIFSGQQIPITALDEAGNVITKFYDIGTLLRVTPHITAGDRVLMELYVERNAYTSTASGYAILKKNATTSIILGPDETLIIGGLTSQDITNAEKGVPILKDLPLIGRLFRYNSKSIEESDVVIIVNADIL